jgi:selenide,water dikinase
VKSPNLLVGLENPDDAGVYQLTDDIAIVQTVDFFTPIVDDPFTFGQIAAANSLSDIYAMGARPVTAMNIVAFPVTKFDISVLKDVLRGGLEKLQEADVVLVGGHSIEDHELKYGLSVTGIIHPQQVLAKQGAQAGDVLILTTPLGTGIISTALKGGAASAAAVDTMVANMATLNRRAAELIQDAGVHACTDITGFGLVGHGYEMAKAGDCAFVINSAAVPVIPEALEYAGMGLVPGGCQANRKFYEPHVEYRAPLTDELRDILHDPQTSGGLFFAVAADRRDALLKKFEKEHVAAFEIGRVEKELAGKIVIE